jgi:hypothetical protein
MALFLVQHQHTSETCPTRSPDMVRALRAHVTEANASRMGMTLLADWVNEPEHTVVLVLESDSRQKVEEFAAPFKQAGSVSIKVGLTCEQTARACLGE